MISPEIWTQIDGFDGQYLVSNKGNVSTKMANGEYKGRKLNFCTDYPSFSVSKRGCKQKTLYIHRVVASTFLGKRPMGMVIRHLDGNRYNNCVENLKYGYPHENTLDAIKHGSLKGSLNGRHKLDEKDVKIIKRLFDENVSLSIIARAFEVSVSAINQIHKNKNWSHL